MRLNERPPFWFIHKGKRYQSHPDRPHELDTRFLEADGFKRNLEQMKLEAVWWDWYTAAARVRVFRSRDPRKILKALVNLDVESHRCAPFLMRHISWYALLALVLTCAGIFAWRVLT